MANRIETEHGWIDVSSGLMNHVTAQSIENGSSPVDELCSVLQDHSGEDSDESDEE